MDETAVCHDSRYVDASAANSTERLSFAKPFQGIDGGDVRQGLAAVRDFDPTEARNGS
jgi:hypothetical protein